MLVAGFFTALVILIGQVQGLVNEGLDVGKTVNPQPKKLMDTLMDEYITAWTPNPFGVNSSFAENGWHPKITEMVEFTSGPGEEHPLKCWLIRDDPWEEHTRDYLVFQQTYGWFGTKQAVDFISYDEILEQYNNDTEYSRFTLDLRYTFEVFVFTTGTPGLWVDLWNENYNITVGTGVNETLDSLSPWSLLGQIMTFRLPGINPFVNALLAVPIYLMLFYMGFVVVRSVIPLLGG